MQEAQQRMKGRLVKEQQALAGMQRSRQAFLAVWEASRRRSRAARIIQRHFRAYRVARLIRRTDMDAKVAPPTTLLMSLFDPGPLHVQCVVCLM